MGEGRSGDREGLAGEEHSGRWATGTLGGDERETGGEGLGGRVTFSPRGPGGRVWRGAPGRRGPRSPRFARRGR